MEVVVGDVAGFADPGRKVLVIGSGEVAIFKLSGAFYAYENVCPHAGGPACQGRMLPLTLEGVDEDLTSRGRVFSKDKLNVTCPWHGMEFDIRTGEHPTSSRLRLRRIEVNIRNDKVVVTLPNKLSAFHAQ